MVANPYGLARVRKPGEKSSDIHDAAFRSRVISFAGTGMSRRGVASACGKPESTIRSWIERGMAYPEVEPWGSFSEDYRRAERGLEGMAAGAIAMTVKSVFELSQRAHDGDEDALTLLAGNSQLKELLNVLAARFPEDWGTSKHRKPEPEFDAANYLDSNTMEREQLGALFCDPPEAIRAALVDSAPAVYAILIAGGFDPAAPRKATDETE
jgi:hypothetical protein